MKISYMSTQQKQSKQAINDRDADRIGEWIGGCIGGWVDGWVGG